MKSTAPDTASLRLLSPRSGTTSAPRPWPEMDRGLVLAAVESAFAAGRSALVVGVPGVGATTLVTAAVELIRPRYWSTVDVGSQADTLPDAPGPLLALLRSRAVLSLPAAAPAPDHPSAASAPSAGAAVPAARMGDGGVGPTAAAPSAPEGGERLCVLADDAHLLPEGTSRALAELARSAEIQLLATMRPAAAGSPPWLGLWRGGRAERVDLLPLTRTEVEELLRRALGGPVAATVARRLWTAAAGIPLYLRELVRLQRAAGLLVERDGVWTVGDGEPSRTRLVDIARHELAALSPECREGLELLALTEPLPLATFVDVVPETVVEFLLEQRLVALGHPGGRHARLTPEVSVVPPAFAEAVRDLTPLRRRRQLLGELASGPGAGPRLPAPPDGLLRTVLSSIECGLPQPVEQVLTAMASALVGSAPEAALQLGDAVLAGGPSGSAPPPEVAARVRLLRAAAWRLLDRPALAAQEASFVPHLLARPMSAASRRALSLRLVEVVEDLHFHGGDTAAALAGLDRFAAGLSPDADRATWNLVRLDRLERLGRAGRHAEALPESLAVLGAGGGMAARALLLVPATAVGLAEHGRFAESVQVLQQHAPAAVSRVETPGLPAGVALAGVLVHLWRGDVEAADRTVTDAADATRPHLDRAGTGDLCRGLLAAARGQWSQAVEALACACACCDAADPAGVSALALAAHALAA
ncbi:MAG: hypothetical protein U0Q15_06490 [Kineosporiaceae bacterium]